jgi:hypothetical protein
MSPKPFFSQGAPWLDLRAEASAGGCVPLPDAGLEAGERLELVASWRARMASEYVSARVFAAMIPQAMAAGISAADTLALAKMAEEEIDHAVRCARVVASLREEPVTELPPMPRLPNHDDASPLEAFLRNVLDVSCISETVAVALVGSERELAGTKELGLELERILADEVGHARFGWRLVEAIVPSLPKTTRERLGAFLAVTFRERLQRFAPFLLLPDASSAAMSCGAPAGPGTFRVFYETLETVSIPRLESFGIPARRAFEAAVDDLARGARHAA